DGPVGQVTGVVVTNAPLLDAGEAEDRLVEAGRGFQVPHPEGDVNDARHAAVPSAAGPARRRPRPLTDRTSARGPDSPAPSQPRATPTVVPGTAPADRESREHGSPARRRGGSPGTPRSRSEWPACTAGRDPARRPGRAARAPRCTPGSG